MLHGNSAQRGRAGLLSLNISKQSTQEKDMPEAAKDWLQQVHSVMEKQPVSELFALLKRDVTVTVVNQAQKFTASAFDWRASSSNLQDLQDSAANPVVKDKTKFFQSRCSLYLYYRVLQGILCKLPNQDKKKYAEDVAMIATNSQFQLALLNCAVEVVAFALSSQLTFPDLTVHLGRLPYVIELWQATQLFNVHLGADSSIPMPESVSSALFFMNMRIVEELALCNGSIFFQMLHTGGGGSSVEGDFDLTSTFLGTLANLAFARTRVVCSALEEGNADLLRIPNFTDRVLEVVHEMLLEHLELLFGQHLSTLLVCCIYGTAKVLGTTIGFRRIIEKFVECFPTHLRTIFKQAELAPPIPGVHGAPPGDATYGDTRQLYNDIFLPCMEHCLEALGEAAPAPAAESSPDVCAPHDYGSSTDEDPAFLLSGRRSTDSARKNLKRVRRIPLKALSLSDINAKARSAM